MEGIFIINFILFLVGRVRSQELQESYDYCDAELKLCEVFTDHTMCKYPVPGLSPQCTPAVHEPLSATEKKRIIFWHNKFRSNIANGTERHKNRKLPTSSNMRQIYWDKELEAIAARWAEQCTSTRNPKVHDKCRNTKRFQVSQNVGSRLVNGMSIDKQAPQIVITWFRESKDFDPSLVDNFTSAGDEKESTRQFTNIIWAETHAIGCARVIFQEQLPAADRNTSVWTVERLICNYGPGGNQVGKPVYKRGASCENCLEGTQCSLVFPGLCANQSAEKVDGQQNTDREEATTEAESTPISSVFSKAADSVPKERVEESAVEVQDEKSFPANEFSEEEEEEEEDEEGDRAATGECQDDKCNQGDRPPSNTPIHPDRRFNEIIKRPKSPAGKIWQGFREAVPRQEGVSSAKRKRRLSAGGKSVRDVPYSEGPEKVRNGERCSCYDVIATDSFASRADAHFFLLLLSTSITVLNCFFSNWNCVQYTDS